MHDNRDQLDDLLDSALASYADPGPEARLEQRILRRVAAVTPAPRRRWFAWAIAVPAGAALVAFVLFFGAKSNRLPATPQKQARLTHQPPLPSEAASRPASRPAPTTHYAETPVHMSRPRRASRATKSAPLPKLQIFPTPQPLSPQEQALVSFAARASRSERESLLEAQEQQEQANAPLHIAALEIKPLEPPSVGAN